ncbi:MAG: tyrosine-protein phosphatase [Ruminococcus sp.]
MSISYDMHTHIIPALDDGAKDVSESLEIIHALSEQGIKNICLTPHFYTHKERVEDFVCNRDEAFYVLKPHLPENINFKVGAEVFVTKYLFAEEHDLKPLCISGTDYMLTEFPYQSTFENKSAELLIRLKDRGIKPILAHVERYEHLLKHPDVIESLIQMGVVIQSNAVSFTDKRFKRKLLKLVSKGYVHILSSDAHSLRRNPPSAFSDAKSIILKKCGLSALIDLENNAESVFGM